MSEPVDGILDDDFKEDERLFHYTSPAGLYGILESDCLWATHYRFLNDEKELFHARPVIVDAVRSAVLARAKVLELNGVVEYQEGTNLKDLSLREAEIMVDAMYAATLSSKEKDVKGFGHPYIFSTFCCAPDEVEDFAKGALVHWGTYGRGGGYALQLNPHKIKRLFKSENERLKGATLLSKKLSYLGRGEVPSTLATLAKAIADASGRIAEAQILGRDLSELEDEMKRTLQPFFLAICCTKDAFFHPEKEARIVVVQPHEHVEGAGRYTLQVRQSSSLAIPYVKLFEGLLLDEAGVIEKVLVGPHPDNERRALALSSFLANRGLSHIGVAISTVPYISQLG